MHAAEREQLILQLMQDRGFIGFKELDRRIEASPATLRRDLDRLETEGRIIRVRGGARLPSAQGEPDRLSGDPFHENIGRQPAQKAAIGRAAAALCSPGEAVIIDGGSTTLQMCPHLAPLGLQVLTNSLHIVSALLPQTGTRITIPGGQVFREQNIVLSAFDEDGAGRFHAARMFMGAQAVSRHGVMQSDVLLVQSERRLLGRANEIVLMVDSSKFSASAGHVLCPLEQVAILITDDGLADADAQDVERAGARLIVAPVETRPARR
ncbi:DeoR/GlpR family DNA-binding transcription regulator [Caulobacter mirabilis]|uniref:DeoR family transcriptional regulator n=1 Tax=Caulobacter mirabilis TaxID=69666 RepID=A0A2D2AWM5_9CAUL|nr:DeoR/GlpR family DNA-binding transcription regulator [Caulobacter mirabilis]ATQ42418.1 DeoR family transcriptional regulator [Caulobacter mirabilis]